MPRYRRLQLGEKRLQQGSVGVPPSDRTGIDRSSDLSGTRCADNSLRAMEVETILIPRQAAMGNNATRHALEVGDRILIFDVDDPPGRQHAMPVRHQRLVMS